jgi:pimeloyl-ACP methyl ester carboxylesterase
MESGYAQVNGLQMYFEVHGDGRPLLLLPGGLLTVDLSFGQLLPLLAPNRRVIAVELQGHGHTADIDRPVTPAALASDVVGLLDELGVDRTDVFGFSLGGLVATQLAIAWPDRVDRVVLASTHFRPDGYHDDVRDPALFATSTRMPTQAAFEQMRAAYEQVAPDPKHFDAFQQKMGASVGSFAGWPPAELAAIDAPTLIVVGDHDFVRLEHSGELRDLVTGSQLAVLPGTTHMDVTSRVELLVPMLERFFDRD